MIAQRRHAPRGRGSIIWHAPSGGGRYEAAGPVRAPRPPRPPLEASDQSPPRSAASLRPPARSSALILTKPRLLQLTGTRQGPTTLVAPTGFAHGTSYSLRGPSPCRLEGVAQRERTGTHHRSPAAPVDEAPLAPPPWHELVPRSSRSLCLTLNPTGGHAVDARNLSSARGVISWSQRSPLRCLALGAFAMPPTSASSTSTTGSLRRSPPSPGGNSDRACGRLTSTNS